MNCAAPAISTLDEGRGDARRHLFVAATLYSDRSSRPVRIRNLSQSGALIEALLVPEAGTAVVLKRGSFQAAGQIVWKTEQKAGIAFSTAISLADWLPRQPGGHQQRVDEIVSSLKQGRQGSESKSTAGVIPDESSLVASIAAFRADLAELGHSLVRDAILVANHPEIQLIDIMLQRLDRITDDLPTA